MKILGIDTSSEQVSVAVGDEESISASFQLASDRRHVESLIPAIELLLRNVGISIHELSAIAVDLGPGLFTGMRVGITTALTLSDIAELPLIGLDSLQVLAHGIERVALQELDDAEIVVPILDARRNQVYWSMHRIDHASGGSLEEIREPRVGEIEELVEDLLDRSQRSVVLGTGAVKYAASLVEVPDLALLGSAPEHIILPSIRTFHMPQLWYHLRQKSMRLVVFKASLLLPFIYVLPMQKFSG